MIDRTAREDRIGLGDYAEGYRFSCRCRICGVNWYERPADLLRRRGFHRRMYLDEVAHALRCPRSRDHGNKAGQRIAVMPIRERRDHHFIGGLA